MTREELKNRIEEIKYLLKSRNIVDEEAYFLRRKKRRLELLFEDLYLDTFDKDNEA